MITVTTHNEPHIFKTATSFKVDGYNLHLYRGKACIAAFHQGTWVSVHITEKP